MCVLVPLSYRAPLVQGGGKVYISWDLSEEVADNLASKFRRRRSQAESDRGEDWSTAAVAESIGIGEETADVLVRCGVPDLHELIRMTARGDVHEELKAVGVSRLGARTKMVKLLSKFYEAQLAKERANHEYKQGKYEAAVDIYSAALESMPCRSATIALHLYNNRAAAYQQLGRNTEALADSLMVLRYDAANSKALGRAERARARGAQTAAEREDAEAAREEAAKAAAAAADAAAECAAVEAEAAAAAVAEDAEAALPSAAPPPVESDSGGGAREAVTEAHVHVAVAEATGAVVDLSVGDEQKS